MMRQYDLSCIEEEIIAQLDKGGEWKRILILGQ